MNARLVCIFVFCTSTTGCLPTGPKISPGVYSKPATAPSADYVFKYTGETWDIQSATPKYVAWLQGDVLEFRVRGTRGSQERIAIRQPSYTVDRRDNRIYLVGSSNDTMYLLGISRFEWFWDGQQIIRKAPEQDGGGTVVYAPAVSATQPAAP
ncbi:hypothetical protein BH09PLA1_BH09PLA1_11270 [soil metagenome]